MSNIQFFSYFLVGGMAAIVEWFSFFILAKGLNIYYINAIIVAFIISTFSNWLIGRNLTFRNSKNKNNILSEITSIYLVSGFGLVINLFFMYLFVNLLNVDLMISKIFGTGIVFIWNFTIRKNIIYKI